MSMVDFLVKVRDAGQLMADAASEYLEKLSPVDQKVSYDPEKAHWVLVEGPSGEYERSEDVNSRDFKALMKDLAAHNDKLTKDGYFYWKFSKSAIIGRKKTK